MRFVSTEGRAGEFSLEQALFAGPAPDGGLFVPTSLSPLPRESLPRGGTMADTSLVVARHLFEDDLPEDVLEPIVRSSFDFPVPLVPLADGTRCLELFHGPTHAFKDVGARFMARLMRHYLRGRGVQATVLVATSGDTGSAVADAFHGLDGIRVVVLFPRGKVTELQRRLFTTLGGNVVSVSVDGTFDDCQRLVKRAFADPSVTERCTLVSANSINVGRLLPQTFYYFHLYAQLEDDGELVVATPSGNFGNLTAGVMAQRMGLPVDRFVAATNVNDVVPEYLRSGAFTPRPSVHTLSNAMDVGDPSNFARLSWLFDADLEAMRRDITGRAYDDARTEAAMAEAHARLDYVLCPHSAVGHLGISEETARHRVFLATAHPAKFRETVERVLGIEVELPESIARSAERPEHVLEIDADDAPLRDLLLTSTEP